MSECVCVSVSVSVCVCVCVCTVGTRCDSIEVYLFQMHIKSIKLGGQKWRITCKNIFINYSQLTNHSSSLTWPFQLFKRTGKGEVHISLDKYTCFGHWECECVCVRVCVCWGVWEAVEAIIQTWSHTRHDLTYNTITSHIYHYTLTYIPLYSHIYTIILSHIYHYTRGGHR